MSTKRRYWYVCAATCSPGVLVPFAFWLSGFDFNHRGPDAACCYLLTLVLSVMLNIVALAAWGDDLKDD